MTDSHLSIQRALESEFRELVANGWYPCVGAKSALNASSIQVHVVDRPDADVAPRLVDLLDQFEAFRGKSLDSVFASFVLAFADWRPVDEDEFERGLFRFLQHVHDIDHAQGCTWDPTASPDPHNRHFGFSINSRAYFLVGMHPRSSRLARRFAVPAIVFNSHFQFAELRRLNAFDKMKEEIRRRDMRLQGSYNPEMVGVKEVSEARQYSGKRQDPSWVCPLDIHHKPNGEVS